MPLSIESNCICTISESCFSTGLGGEAKGRVGLLVGPGLLSAIKCVRRWFFVPDMYVSSCARYNNSSISKPVVTRQNSGFVSQRQFSSGLSAQRGAHRQSGSQMQGCSGPAEASNFSKNISQALRVGGRLSTYFGFLGM